MCDSIYKIPYTMQDVIIFLRNTKFFLNGRKGKILLFAVLTTIINSKIYNLIH